MAEEGEDVERCRTNLEISVDADDDGNIQGHPVVLSPTGSGTAAAFNRKGI